MDELEQSIKYVPTYQVIKRIRKEEKLIAKEKLDAEKNKTKTAEDKARAAKLAEKQVKEKLVLAIHFLNEKDIPAEQIGTILDIDIKDVQKILKKKTTKIKE